VGGPHDLEELIGEDGGGWRRLLDDDGYGWVLLDSAGVIRYVNTALADMLDWPLAEAIGRLVFDYVSRDDLDHALGALAELVENAEQEMVQVGLPMVLRVQRGDGTSMPVEVGAWSYLDEAGEGFVRLRVRDARRDQALHDYLELLASVGPDHDTVLRAGAHLADLSLVGGSTAISERDERGVLRGLRSASLPSQVVAAVEAAAGVSSAPWNQVSGDEAVVVPCTDLPEPARTAALDAGFRSCWCEPITVNREGMATPLLLIFRPWLRPPLIGHRVVARDLRATLGLSFLAREARNRLVLAAQSDALTGLVNRSAAFDRLALEVKDAPTGVLYVDLDGFKGINDSRGHGVGDDVLVAAADQLRTALGGDAVAARIGGDEFLVIVGGGPTTDELVELAQLVVDRLSSPMDTASGAVELSATVGVARSPDHGTTPDEVVEAADRALYRAKRAGGSSWSVAGDGAA
jgi:diguanylate cyclase (GGDEF)-like protein/PAS domain S-box-containing protein